MRIAISFIIEDETRRELVKEWIDEQDTTGAHRLFSTWLETNVKNRLWFDAKVKTIKIAKGERDADILQLE